MAIVREPYTLYASGFTSYTSCVSSEKQDIDHDVVRLYTLLRDKPWIVSTWEYKVEVMKTVSRLIFPFYDWVEAQRRNVLISKHAVLFVRDTLKAACGGNRDLPIDTRCELFSKTALGSNEDWKRHDLSNATDYIDQDLLNACKAACPTNGSVLATWMRTQGARDIIKTLYAMYGDCNTYAAS